MMKTECTIAYITAGAGGMFCGSCMHDNTLVRALRRLGVDAQLIPTYTPIRTDEDNVSVDRVFLGGINVFLEQWIPLFRVLPQFATRVFDQPWLIRWMTSRSKATDARFLGALAVSVLRGAAGNQRKEAERLCHWLAVSMRPRMVIFTNILIAGCAERLRRELRVPLLVTLQGDDAFVEALPEPYRSEAHAEIRRIVPHIDGFLVHSRFYAGFMKDYFGIGEDKLHIVPLGIDTADFPKPSAPNADTGSYRTRAGAGRTVGYLARLAPEKGLHVLVDAFLGLRQRGGNAVRLEIAGWLGADHRSYAESQFRRLRDAGRENDFRYVGTVDRRGKLEFLRSIDVFSVPTTYRDPKGLFVLEALAAGVPVVEPAHGAFPEMLADLGGGRLVPPGESSALANTLAELLSDDATLRRLGYEGAVAVHSRRNAEAAARETWTVLRSFLDRA